MSIEQFSALNPRYIPLELLVPENCGLFRIEEDPECDLFHVSINESGFAEIEILEGIYNVFT